MSHSDGVAQLYPQAQGYPFVAYYVSQGYSGGILTYLHTGCRHHKEEKYLLLLPVTQLQLLGRPTHTT
jgi:hypothetical protein